VWLKLLVAILQEEKGKQKTGTRHCNGALPRRKLASERCGLNTIL
jgi:hypothetical protein